MEEIWKKIEWYENYEVSNMWKIRKWDKLHSIWSSNWYSYIGLSNLWKRNFSIHRLVALSFIINQYNKSDVNHIDGDKSNNNVSNLEWVTKSENQIHSRKILWNKSWFQTNNPSLWKFWKDNKKSKKVNQFDKIWNFIKSWDSMMDIQRELWIKQWIISDVCRWRIKTCRWFIWKYN